MGTRQTISTCCLIGALVLLGFAVLNASQQPPATAAAWLEGVLGVALLVLGVQVRKGASRRTRVRS